MKPWTMPPWMERYRHLIVNTGGNSVEDMMNGDADPRVNLPLSTLQACVKSQISLLHSLQQRGLLRKGNQLSPTQLEVAKRMRDSGRVLVSVNGGFWTIEDSKADKNGVPEWSVDIRTVHAMERKGILERTLTDSEWCDPRRLAR